MSPVSKAVELVNVRLVHLGGIAYDDTCLGVVTVPKHLWNDLVLPTLRQIMKEQLPLVLPERFIFCTKARHDILHTQESAVLATQIFDCVQDIILIKNYNELPGVLIKDIDNRQISGHIYCALSSSLTILRDTIHTSCPAISKSGKSYEFLYSDESAVPFELEEDISLHKCLKRHTVHIRSKVQTKEDAECHELPQKRKVLDVPSIIRTKALRLSFSSSKDVDRQPNIVAAVSSQSSSDSKQLLLSYVRAEAAEHALSLKRKLTEIGFSVFLDVHEIKTGIDWQDALNYAVSNCEVFVPLVTPRYGETQWTNREVKLADVLGKPILPISFLEEWPPRCLAIQFATTQFIHWKTPEQIQEEIEAGKAESAKDIRLWEVKYIENVAKNIAKRLKTSKIGMVPMSKPALTRMKTLMKTFAGRLPASAAPVLSNHDSDETTGPQIVICVHSDEGAFGLQMKGWLEEAGHVVWVSTIKDKLVLGEDIISSSQEASLIEIKKECEDKDKCDGKSAIITAEQVAEFQEAVDRATVIIIILSNAFTQSKVCREQVFYCEHRKQILPVAYEDFKVPAWLKMLLRTQRLVSVNKPCFHKTLLMQVKRALDPTAKNCLDSDSQEANITLAVHYLKKALTVQNCVYVAGATKVSDSRSEAICRTVGTQLAALDNIAVVTGGSYGMGELVGRAFHEESQRRFKPSSVWHVLPERDAQDMSERYNQCSDGTFALKDFGQTLFCGNSVWEKEAIVGRCFQICLLIEGGADSAHEVGEFVWSDHIVVPVGCPKEAAVGDCKLADKLYQLPPGVSEKDWKSLSDCTTPVEEIGQAVTNIISDLQKHLSHQEDSPSKATDRDSVSSSQTPDIMDLEEFLAAEDKATKSLLGKAPVRMASLRSLQTILSPH